MHLSVTAIDSLSSLWLLDLKDEFQEVEEDIVEAMDFDKADTPVSLFEVNIRILGGLLSAYELSSTRYSDHTVFLTKAKDLGDRLLSSFEEPGQFPPGEIVVSESAGVWKTYPCYVTQWGPVACTGPLSLAEIGTLSMEFSALTYHTGERRYEEKVEVMRNRVEKWWGKRFPLLPNEFWPEERYAEKYSFAGGADSYYEYLLKEFVHSGYEKQYLKTTYEESIHGLMDNLLQQDTSGFVYVSEISAGKVVPKMDHLACFVPGMMVYSLIHIPSQNFHIVLETAKQLARTCHEMYASTPTGLAPETTWFDNGLSRSWFSDRHYALRPEAVESWYYLYAYTGDPIYREWGWSFFQSLVKHCRTDSGYAELKDVETGEAVDSMPSYFLAETLKYLYLLFAEEVEIDLREWVFTTEGHLLRAKKSKP